MLLVVLGPFIGVWLWALIDAIGKPRDLWDEAGQSKPLWIILLLLLNVFFLSTILYFAMVRPQLVRAGRAGETGYTAPPAA